MTAAGTCRGALCIPAFERATPKAPPPSSPEGTKDGSDIDSESIPVYEADYDFEELEWQILPDFVERVRKTDCFSAGLGCRMAHTNIAFLTVLVSFCW